MKQLKLKKVAVALAAIGVMASAQADPMGLTANAGTVTISGYVSGACTITVGNLNVGSHLPSYFAANTFDLPVTTNCTTGIPYKTYIDDPNSTAWTFNSNKAKNISGNAGEVWLEAFQDDGVTQLTPSASWDRTGTGADQTTKFVLKISPKNDFFGAFSGTIVPTTSF